MLHYYEDEEMSGLQDLPVHFLVPGISRCDREGQGALGCSRPWPRACFPALLLTGLTPGHQPQGCLGQLQRWKPLQSPRGVPEPPAEPLGNRRGSTIILTLSGERGEKPHMIELVGHSQVHLATTHHGSRRRPSRGDRGRATVPESRHAAARELPRYLSPASARQAVNLSHLSVNMSPPSASSRHLGSSAVSKTDPLLALFTALIPTSLF